MSLFDILQKYKDTIRIMELAAMFHDLDKGNKEFCADSKYHTLRDSPREESRKIKLDRWRELGMPMNEKIPDAGIDFSRLCSPVEAIQIDSGNGFGLLSDPFTMHHEKETNGKCILSLAGCIVHAGGCGADGLDSGLDKDAQTKHEQDKSKPFVIATPFKKESREWDNSRLSEVATLYQSCADIRKYREILSCMLGETRIPLNDVTLWDHGFNVASFAKAIIAKILMEYHSTAPENCYEIPLREQGNIGFCKIAYDIEYLMGKVHDSADLRSLLADFAKVMNGMRDYYENELLIGNEYYRDHFRQVFIMPKLNDNLRGEFEKDLLDKLRDKMRALLRENSLQELPFGFAKFQYQNSYSYTEDKKEDGELMRKCMELMKERIPTRQDPQLLLELKKNVCANRICDVCGLRNATFNEGNNSDHLCGVCKERRKRKTEENCPMDNINLDALLGNDENKLAYFSIRMDLSALRGGTLLKAPSSPARLSRAHETLRQLFEDYLGERISFISQRGYSRILLSPERLDFIVPATLIEKVTQAFLDAYKYAFSEFDAWSKIQPKIAAIAFYENFPLYAVIDASAKMSAMLKPGEFDFMLLDSTAWRFAFTSAGRRHHIFQKAESYTLMPEKETNVHSFPAFAQLWDIIGSLPKSQLGNIEGQLVAKHREYMRSGIPTGDSVFRMLCELFLFAPNALGKKNLSPEQKSFVLDAAAGHTLLDMFDLVLHIENKK